MSSPCVDPGGRSGLSGHLIMGFFEVKKVYPNAGAAVQDVLFDGMTIVSGGFGLCGIPERLIAAIEARSEEHTSELQSLMRISYAVFCLKKKQTTRPYQYRRKIKLRSHF